MNTVEEKKTDYDLNSVSSNKDHDNLIKTLEGEAFQDAIYSNNDNVTVTGVMQSEIPQPGQKREKSIFYQIKRTFLSYGKSVMGNYYKRTDGIPVEILPGFYLGSIGAAFNKDFLDTNKIENILNCCDGLREAYPKSYKYKNLELLDVPSENITLFFEETSDYIHKILSEGKKVLVHCYKGRSRSVSIIVCYLLTHHNMTVDEALELIKSKRACIEPNSGFLEQLKNYEKQLQEKKAGK